jgi:phosphoribosylamine--glycine ligase
MNVLLLGSGGREHALAWKLSKSSEISKIYVFPGNDGMRNNEKVELLKKTEGELLDFISQKAKELNVSLVIVGPENLLEMGVVDRLEKEGIPVLGPSQEAAKLESSKIFSKEFMRKNNIPTAKSEGYHSYEDAIEGLKKWDINLGVAIKADELAAGKGVVVTSDIDKAHETLFDFMKNPDCSVKTKSILIEQKLFGKEVSAFALCDGKEFVVLGYACDYKRVGDGDTGANTGGMGGYSPKSWPSDKCKKTIENAIFSPVLKGMAEKGTPFKGILFAGLMIKEDEPSVIEFNVRFGDPEAQILMPLIEWDVLPVFMAAAKGELSSISETDITMNPQTAVHVVLASQGYPSLDSKGMFLGQPIKLPLSNTQVELKEDKLEKCFLFLAGVKNNKEGELVNSGGRVLGLTALGDDLSFAREKAYEALKKISFDGAHWRSDIGL